ncbi:hypothetical protein ACOY9F_24490, partial [Citrobacter portucalensis]
LNCQELAAQQPLRPINWCSRLLKMTAVIEKRIDGTDIVHVRPHGRKSLCMGKIIADLLSDTHANNKRD